MPELPDVAIYIEALEARILGQTVERVRLASPFLLRTIDPPLAATHDKKVRRLRRIGKRIAIGLESDLWLVLHLMIAGRLHWREHNAKLPGKNAPAAFDFSNGTLVLTEAGSQKRASLHVVAGEQGLHALDAGGIDVFEADHDSFAHALTSANHTLKRALTDPRLFSGIGNAYSDEILHRARLSPVALTQKLAPEEIARLHDGIKATLLYWVDRLRAQAGGNFPEKVTAFREGMAVHGRYGQPCPDCGAKVQRIRYASNETNYCARCQTGGRLLADRALSRLLREDWPPYPGGVGKFAAPCDLKEFSRTMSSPSPAPAPSSPRASILPMPDRTVFRVLEEAAELYGNAPALHQPYTKDGKRLLRTVSWAEYRTAAEEIAAGLRTLGIRKGDVVALDSETRVEFYLADLGIMANGSVAAALYPTYPPKELVCTIQACDAKAVFVEDPKTLERLKEAPVAQWILLTGEAPGAITLDQLRQRGREAIARDPALLTAIRAEVQPSDNAILYLTSGATGEPKMVMVSHRALVANIDMGPNVLPTGPNDRTVAFLPSAHIAQRVVVELLPIRSGMPVTFAESLMKLPQDIKAVRPTIFLAPPRLWERIYSTICTELKKRPAVAQKLFYAGLALGLAAARHRRKNEPVPARIRIPLAAIDRLAFSKVRARFGGQMRVAASGAAPLGAELAEFYEAIGMPLIEGYGLTEGGVVAFNPIARPKPGSIGKLLPGVEVRIAEDGELLVKSPCLFTGYYKDGAATAEVLRDGWLHTGDIASMDDDGYLFITGRKKEMIISSNGKKIYPSRVENLFKFEPLVSHVILIGDRLPFLTALFTINTATAELLEGMKALRGCCAADIASAPPVRAELQKIVQRVNKQLAPFEQVRKFRILTREFCIEEGELTATMKVRRMRVLENFRDHIEELYAGKEESH